MPSDDLSSIQGLEDKHLRSLARQHVTDFRGLVHADRRVIYRAMTNMRPRPTLEQISRWQDDARSKLEKAVADTSDWHTAASFVVVFSQRQVDGAWERRVEAERTEVEPEQNMQVWSGWACEPICGWMLAQLAQAGARSRTASENGAADAQDRPAEEPAGVAGPPAAEPPSAEPLSTGPPAGRTQLHIDTAAIIDATGRADVVTDGVPVACPGTELVAPVRVILTVSGAPPQTQLQAVTRILRRDGPGWNAQDPVVVPASGQAEFDLSRVPAGDHEMSLIAWAPDATAKPVSVRLPRVRIRPAAD